jgi:hypothetical protein
MGLLQRVRDVLAGPSRAPENAGPAGPAGGGTGTRARDEARHAEHDDGPGVPEGHGTGQTP